MHKIRICEFKCDILRRIWWTKFFCKHGKNFDEQKLFCKHIKKNFDEQNFFCKHIKKNLMNKSSLANILRRIWWTKVLWQTFCCCCCCFCWWKLPSTIYSSSPSSSSSFCWADKNVFSRLGGRGVWNSHVLMLLLLQAGFLIRSSLLVL